VLLNNRSLGMVRQWQQLFFDKRYSSTLLPEFDFAGFVRVCGAVALSVSTPAEFATAFKQALGSVLPTVIIADIDTDLIVNPMVYPGQPIDQFID
jgi:acetolactate synthase-1/2/3 large subunit